MADFELLHSLKSNDEVPIYKYKSKNTGMKVYIAEVAGPIVCGNFFLATEAFDDDGLPHTLEHLIFLGSEEYPYKGVLDLLSNRCLAYGTNAGTAVDYTVYDLETVGSEGFLAMLPIFLDHILHPTLTDSAYLTEVHHITGNGEDAGVVYCELQSTENSREFMVHNEMLRAIYPGKCGYKTEPGGLLKNLRESTNNEKVKNYHKEFYRTENLSVIIIGQVNHADVFEALRVVEEKNLSKRCDKIPFTKPWQNPVPPFTETVVRDVLYPCDDEESGLVHIAWRGPSSKNIYDVTACNLLMNYLCETSVSPLQKKFIEIEDPYANDVRCSTEDNSITCYYLVFDGVPFGKIQSIKDLLVQTLKNIHDSNNIDMKRMETVIRREIVDILHRLERNPSDLFSRMLMLDVLFGNTKEDLEQRLNQMEDLKKLLKEPISYWLNLLNHYFIDAPMVVVNGIPSCAKQKEFTEIEKKRVAEQIEKLGKEGLERKERELQEAKTLNEVPIPPEILNSVPIPGTEGIKFYRIKSYSTETSEQHPRFDVSKLPIYTYLDHVDTNFIYMHVIMDTTLIDTKSRPYLPILLEAMTESPIERNGDLIPYEKVVAEIGEDTISTDARLFFMNTAKLTIFLELSKYAKGVQWIQEILYNTKFTVERLKILIAKKITQLSIEKKYGGMVQRDLNTGLLYNKDSNQYTSISLTQHKFLTRIMERLTNEEGQKEVLMEIEAVRKILTSPETTALILIVNVDKLTEEISDVYSPWKMLKNYQNVAKNRLDVTPEWQLMNQKEDIPIEGCVLGLGCEDTACFTQCTNGINDYEHPDLAPLLVCLQYLQQKEGPMWKGIRGQGLSYGFNIMNNTSIGLLYLSFSEATNAVEVYKEAKNVIKSHVNENKWERLLFESAKSSLIFGIINKEKTVGRLVDQALVSHFRKTSHDYNYRKVQKIYGVTIEDMNRVATKYLNGLFDPKKCITTIVCHSTKAPEVAEAFKLFDYDLKLYTDLEKSFLNDL